MNKPHPINVYDPQVKVFGKNPDNLITEFVIKVGKLEENPLIKLMESEGIECNENVTRVLFEAQKAEGNERMAISSQSRKYFLASDSKEYILEVSDKTGEMLLRVNKAATQHLIEQGMTSLDIIQLKQSGFFPEKLAPSDVLTQQVEGLASAIEKGAYKSPFMA